VNTDITILKGGTIIDGSGREPFRADLRIRGRKIDLIGDIPPDGGEVLDVTGLVVAPGFIDIHSHSDCFPLAAPRCESKLLDGVTTDVSGNCGSSPFPLRGEFRSKLSRELAEFGIAVDWDDIEGYFDRIRSNGIAVNLAILAGHGAIRASVMGYEGRPPDAQEMAAMKRELRRALEAGAFGMSTGLIYPPGCYADSDEIAELCRVVKDFNGMYATHMRSEADKLEDAVLEALDVARRSGVRLQISHLKVAGRANWGKIQWLLDTLRAARDEGIDLACDRYPYTASSTGLDVILPDWACEGGVEAEIGRLKDPAERRRIITEIEPHSTQSGRWSNIVISYTPSEANRQWEGRSVADIARAQGKPPVEAALDLIVEERANVSVVIFSMCELNLRAILGLPFVAVGSDAAVRCARGALGAGKPHPRAYGTFARVLGRYAREEELFPLTEAIRKMTSLPAARLGLEQRGLLKKDWYADIVVFDPERVKDNATYADPHRYSSGIRFVFVNGVMAAENGKATGRLAGEVLRR